MMNCRRLSFVCVAWLGLFEVVVHAEGIPGKQKDLPTKCGKCHCAFEIPAPQEGSGAGTTSSTDLETSTTTEAPFKELVVESRETSTFKRKKTSAPDERPSSAKIGLVVALCGLIPFVLIVLSDLFNLVHWMVRRGWRRDVKKRSTLERSSSRV